MGMIATLNARLNRAAGGYLRSQRSYDPYSFIYSTGMRYPLYGLQQTIAGHEEEIPSDFTGYVQAAYRGNGVVFACMLARMMLFSEARFTWRQIRSGAPGKLFGTADLAVLEHPWPSGTTGDLLARAIVDVDLSGNAFLARRPGPTIKRMRPDWVTIILGSQGDPDTQAGESARDGPADASCRPRDQGGLACKPELSVNFAHATLLDPRGAPGPDGRSAPLGPGRATDSTSPLPGEGWAGGCSSIRRRPVTACIRAGLGRIAGVAGGARAAPTH